HGKLLQEELLGRLRYLSRVGLGYLTLDRQARTLSGGESQRVTLTAALGTSLHNALFVLDEPTVGLHASDVAPLTQLVGELAERNNSVIVIEHEPLVILGADRIVELGPGAGERGGHVTFDGTVAAARKAGGATARALAQPKISRESAQTQHAHLMVRGARGPSLTGVDATFPLGHLIAVGGPGGSRKGSLAGAILCLAGARHLGVADVERPGEPDAVEGL